MQYGGRNSREANDPVLMNKIILDFHRMTYKQITIVQQDLSACFDRTIQNIAKICNRKFSIPYNVFRLNNQIKKIQNFISHSHREHHKNIIRTRKTLQFMDHYKVQIMR